VHLSVGDLEPDVGDAGGGGEPACFGYEDLGQVRAQGVPAAGGAGGSVALLTGGTRLTVPPLPLEYQDRERGRCNPPARRLGQAGSVSRYHHEHEKGPVAFWRKASLPPKLISLPAASR
jgi:hypothetical protein